MTATMLKKELHKAIDNIEDESFLQAVYTIINKQSLQYEYELTPDQKEELDRRIELHKNEKSKSYSWSQAKKMLKARLKK